MIPELSRRNAVGMHWDEAVYHVWRLAQSYRRGQLALFLGAGVAKECGIPLWPELVQRFVAEFRRHYSAGSGNASMDAAIATWRTQQDDHLSREPWSVQCRYCKERLGDSYHPVLRQALYGASPQAPCSSLLKAIANLDGLLGICSYNYDDLLESASDGRLTPSTMPRHGTENVVHHVHGLIPRDPGLPISGDIVFAEDEYFLLGLNRNAWANTVQVDLMRRAECVLFLGISFNDPAVRHNVYLARQSNKGALFLNVCSTPRRVGRRRIGAWPCSGRWSTHIQIRDGVMNDLGVKNMRVDQFGAEPTILVEAIKSQDPIHTYTTKMQRLIRRRAERMKRVGPCGSSGCGSEAIQEWGHCLEHCVSLPMNPLTPAIQRESDVCAIDACMCVRIAHSDLCFEHALRRLYT